MFCIIFDILGFYGPYIDIVSIWSINLSKKTSEFSSKAQTT